MSEAPDLDAIRADVVALAGRVRDSAGAGERAAAQWASERLAGNGAREACTEEYRGRATNSWSFAAHGLAGLVALRVGGLRGALLALATAVSLERDASGRSPWRRRVIGGGRGANAVGRVPAAAQRRATVVLVAHLDAARTGLVWSPAVVRAGAARHVRTRRVEPVMGLQAAGLLAAAAAGVLPRTAPVRRVPAGFAALACGAAVALNLDIARSPTVPGANDNATGVAAALELARLVAAAPLEHTDLIVALVGGEESGMGGFNAFLRAHAAELDPATTLVVGLDTLGSGTPILAGAEGAVLTHRYQPQDLARVDAGAALAGEPAPERWRIGAWTDPLLALHTGLPAVSLLSIGPGYYPHYHHPSDVPEHVDWASVGACARIALGHAARLRRRAVGLPAAGAGGALEGPADVGSDPAAVEAACLRADALVVQVARVHAPRVEGDVVAQGGEGGNRVGVGPRRRLGRATAGRHVEVACVALPLAERAVLGGGAQAPLQDVSWRHVDRGRMARLEHAHRAGRVGDHDAAELHAHAPRAGLETRRARVVPDALHGSGYADRRPPDVRRVIAPARTAARGVAVPCQNDATMSSKSAKKPATAKQDPAKRRNIIIASVVALALVAAAIVIIAGSGGSSNSATPAGAPLAGTSETKALLDGIPQSGNVLGKANAPVTMYEYIDYQCPFCKEFTLTTYPQVINDYVRTGKVKLIQMPLTFIGPDSEKAARAAAGAGQQNRQFNFADLWYFNSGQENSGYVTDAFINKIYDGAGVDKAKANAYRATQASKAQGQAAQAGAQKYGVVSTPSFVIGKTGGPYQKLEIDTSSEAGFKAAFDTFLKGN